MTKSIGTYEELLQEKARLKLLLSAQKELVRHDVNELKKELAPVISVITTVGKIATKDNRNLLLTTTVDTVIDFVVKKIVLSKAGWITKLVVPFFMKNFSSHIIADNKDKILNKISSWIGNKNANGKEGAANEESQQRLADPEED